MKLLYSIKEVFSNEGYLKEQAKEYFNIPLYQRGYKWTPKEVCKLLVDINNFDPVDEKFYCLQNITIVPVKKVFNVVDGQQRLTTLTLVLGYLGERELAKNKVRFPENSIRDRTNIFINEIIISNKIEILGKPWFEFVEENKGYDHQDIYHLFAAYNAIDSWFSEEKRKSTKDNFLNKLLNNVKLIVNKIETESDEEEIFSNLNSKRIPLDGADLFRAILITRVASEEQKKEANIKDIIQLNERRIKIGWEFDQINNWWSQEKVKSYFKYFINIKSEKAGSSLELFDRKKHPINQLLFLFAEAKKETVLSLELMEKYNNEAGVLYQEILNLHNILVDWFEDRTIYHFLGFIFANTNIRFFSIWEKWNNSKTRSCFIEKLRTDIKESIFKEDSNINFTDTNTDWYYGKKTLLVQVLILLDVIASLEESQAFIHPAFFTKSSNDIEHIFPQNPADVKEKKEFIQFLNKRVEEKDQIDLGDFDIEMEKEAYKTKIEDRIKKHIEGIKINSIGNLVLLYSSLNRSIGRNSYAKKRSRIIKYFNSGKYIQPHTFRVFVRYFVDGESDTVESEHWTNKDIEANAKTINNKIKEFFKLN